jgi:uncharacterized protein (TIGR00296 family)
MDELDLQQITLQEGQKLVQKAREAVELYLSNYQKPQALAGSIFEKNFGVFVTLNSYPDMELRGCIGFVNPIKKLGESVIESAIAAATNDFRFDPIQKEDLNKIVFEVSVLDKPKLLVCPPEKREQKIKVPKDGLIIEYGGFSGLLLPQVAAEYKFSPKQFLEAVAQKAGLPARMYLSSSANIYTFGARIFYEESPKGKIKEKKLIL